MNNENNLMKDIDTSCGWKQLSIGGAIYGSGNSMSFETGDWRIVDPIWQVGKCKNCMLCFLVCPDSSIPIMDGKREDFDFDHCKGCGICYEACPFGAISFGFEREE